MTVDQIYKSVQAQAAKSRTGYSSAAEFNLQLKLAEELLYDFHTSNLPRQPSIDALRAFNKFEDVAIDSGLGNLPSDYRRYIGAIFKKFYAGACATDNVTERYRTHLIQPHELPFARLSPIRGGKTRARYSVCLVDGGIEVLPNEKGTLELTYYRKPTYAVYGVTVTASGEVYDSASSTQPEWPDEELNNLVDLLLFYKGVQFRETPLIQYAFAKPNLKRVLE